MPAGIAAGSMIITLPSDSSFTALPRAAWAGGHWVWAGQTTFSPGLKNTHQRGDAVLHECLLERRGVEYLVLVQG
ncbi:MAG TPA: hypothetical protein VK817_17065 [Trebonia sp.]|jgi:hypothetical protein|nr:hypothetical protein [Trebonia sp.]